MAKKKAQKKTTKKKAKKTTKKKAANKPKPRRDPLPRYIGLQAKILKVMKAVPIIECTGQEYDEKTGETYYYTEAAEVFRIYTEQFIIFGLTFVPIKSSSIFDGRAYKATVIYRLTDAETNQFQDVELEGLGCNGAWALNSAQTVARKQALLNMFGASYPQPETPQQVVRKAVKMFRPIEAISGTEAVEELKQYFKQEKPNERASESRESVRSTKRPAKSRVGKNNPAKTGRSKTAKTN